VGGTSSLRHVHGGYAATELEPGLKENAFYDPTNFTFPSGVHICEVEVDPETGNTDIVAWTAVDDFGVVIKPCSLLVTRKILEPTLRQLGVAHCVQEIAVAEVVPVDERIQSFLNDVLELKGVPPTAIPDGVHSYLGGHGHRPAPVSKRMPPSAISKRPGQFAFSRSICENLVHD
jgi:Molybdopterin-binding domain of aldehyde dehydrogenase